MKRYEIRFRQVNLYRVIIEAKDENHAMKRYAAGGLDNAEGPLSVRDEFVCMNEVTETA